MGILCSVSFLAGCLRGMSPNIVAWGNQNKKKSRPMIDLLTALPAATDSALIFIMNRSYVFRGSSTFRLGPIGLCCDVKNINYTCQQNTHLMRSEEKGWMG